MTDQPTQNPTPQDVREARDYLATLPDKRAVQVHRFIAGLNKRPRDEIVGQLPLVDDRGHVSSVGAA